MLIIEHRKNTSDDLLRVPESHGVEVDLRSDMDGIYIAHDPLVVGERFDSWLENYSHSQLVLNVKEEGLETEVRKSLENNGISNYFFLDQSVPFLVRNGLSGYRDGACRASRFEQPPPILTMMCEWVWVDFIDEFPGHEAVISELQNRGLKVCVASPELHDSRRESEATTLAASLRHNKIRPNAVCTKNPLSWEVMLS